MVCLCRYIADAELYNLDEFAKRIRQPNSPTEFANRIRRLSQCPAFAQPTLNGLDSNENLKVVAVDSLKDPLDRLESRI